MPKSRKPAAKRQMIAFHTPFVPKPTEKPFVPSLGQRKRKDTPRLRLSPNPLQAD